jgi:hypothetical protein
LRRSSSSPDRQGNRIWLWSRNFRPIHWVLDVAFDGDAARSRKDNAPQNLALIRKLALNILRQNPEKASIKVKIKRAGWDETFLLSLLRHMR